MSFKYQGQLSGGKENPITVMVKIANSETVAIGEALQMVAFSSGGGCKRAAAGSEILGICVGIVNDDGIDLDNANPTSYDGTWTPSSSSYAAASDNMTDKAICAIVNVDVNSLWINTAAGALAAADEFKFFDITSATQIADQDGDDSKGAFILIRRDPKSSGSSTQGLFKIAESELDAYAQQ